MNTATSSVTRPVAVRQNALVVVTANHQMPDWAHNWCGGRRLRVLSVAEGIECLAAVAAHAGTSTLVVTGRSCARPESPSVVAAVRDLPDDDGVLVEAASVADHLAVPLVLTHVVPLSFGERSVGLDEAIEHGHRVLESAVERLSVAGPGVVVLPRLLRQHPHELVGEELSADLLVLGGPHRCVPSRLGLVASSAVQHAPCPVLLAARARPRARSAL
jgi:nucleotide-binding universal stress UspA family protein